MTANPSEWTDDEFLSYVVTHSETPRALFSADMVVRLLKLAGRDALARDVENGSRKFYPLHEESAGPLVKEARDRIRAAKQAAEAKVDRARMAARQYHVVAERALDG